MSDPGMKDDWLRHPFTAKMQKQIKAMEAQAHAALKNACANTSDPKVARAYATYESLGVMGTAMEQG